ncbi:MAG: GTP-binding protein, partial [Stenotrophomonas sp.]
MTPIKFVVSGPVGAGKTTFIRTISQVEVVSTEEKSTEEIGKTHTTVALDFGQMNLGDHVLHLFGTPGQTRFDYMWDVLSEG